MAAPVNYSQAVSKEPQEACRDYLRTGRCKYGASCKYFHPPNVQSGGGMKGPVNPSEPLFPIRPKEPPCQYYLKHGTCKFGQSCKFHHPPQSGRSTVIGGSSVVMNVGPGRSANEAHLPQTFVVNSLGGEHGANISAMSLQFLPQRPGEPDCIYFLRNGRCKYGATCRYHHPVTVQHTKPSAPQEITRSPSEGRSRSRSLSDAVPANVQYVHQSSSSAFVQQGYHGNVGSQGTASTHILVSDRPVSVVTVNSANDLSSLEGSRQHLAVGARSNSSMRQDFSSMPSSPVVTSVASSYETALSEMPVPAGDGSNASWNHPSRTPSGGSLSSTYAESPGQVQVQYVRTGSGNRVALSTSVSDTNIAGRYHGMSGNYGSHFSEGSPSYHRMSSNPVWGTSSRNRQVRGGREGSSVTFEQPSQTHREQPGTVATAAHRHYQDDNANNHPPGLPMTLRGPRKSQQRQPSELDDDEGLTMMTSALLTMLDTPDEGASSSPDDSVPISDDTTVPTNNFEAGNRPYPSNGVDHHGGSTESSRYDDSTSQWSRSLQGAPSVGRPLERNIQSMAAFPPHPTAQGSPYATNGNFYLP